MPTVRYPRHEPYVIYVCDNWECCMVGILLSFVIRTKWGHDNDVWGIAIFCDLIVLVLPFLRIFISFQEIILIEFFQRVFFFISGGFRSFLMSFHLLLFPGKLPLHLSLIMKGQGNSSENKCLAKVE